MDRLAVPLPCLWSICLPLPGGRLAGWIAPGSALIARPDADGGERMIADFEGNLYDASNLRDYHSRLAVAAWRSAELAPTVARAWIKPGGELLVIGELRLEPDGTLRPRIDPSTDDALARWLGIPRATRAAWRAALPGSLAWPNGHPLTSIGARANYRTWAG